MRAAQLPDGWTARLDRLGRLQLVPLLAAATGLAALGVAGGYHTWVRFDRGLILVAATAVWSLALLVRPRPEPAVAGRWIVFGVHLGLAATLVWVNPWYGVFAFTTYFFADDLGVPWRRLGFVLTAAVLAASQAGGYPAGLDSRALVYTAMIGVNVLAMLGVVSLTSRVISQNEERAQAITELAEANHRLEAALAENAGLHAQLLVQAREAGVVEERQRLAGEIHDTLAQGLAGIVAQLEAAEQARQLPGARSRHLAQARALARSSLTEARRSVRALHPEQLEEASLPEALGELARVWSERSGIPVAVEVAGYPTRAGADAEAAVFRVAQEGLSNVAKHADAATVHLTLTYTDDGLLLDLADDGMGFDPGVDSGGYGVVSMRRRLERAGGALTVESTPGEGTTLGASVPLA